MKKQIRLRYCILAACVILVIILAAVIKEHRDSGADQPNPTPSYTPVLTQTSTPAPSLPPTSNPTLAPTLPPTSNPTLAPTLPPTSNPTLAPTVSPTCTTVPRYTNSPTPTFIYIPGATETPEVSSAPAVTNTPVVTCAPAITPIIPTQDELDFNQHLSKFEESFFTIGCRGTYRIKGEAPYYNADGTIAGYLHSGDMVYANASNTFYKEWYVYRVVIDDSYYYIKAANLYGTYMGAEVDYPADQDETEAYCIAYGLTSYSHGDIWYFDQNGCQHYETVYDVTKDGKWYFVSLYRESRITDNCLTYKIPWGDIYCRYREDSAGFSEVDKNTGHTYVFVEDTFCFLDLDFDGVCEYEVKVDEWFRWKALN